jgi:hypothetical protein
MHGRDSKGVGVQEKRTTLSELVLGEKTCIGNITSLHAGREDKFDPADRPCVWMQCALGSDSGEDACWATKSHPFARTAARKPTAQTQSHKRPRAARGRSSGLQILQVKETQEDKALCVNAPPTPTKFDSDNGDGSLGPFLIRRLGPEQRCLSRRSRRLSSSAFTRPPHRPLRKPQFEFLLRYITPPPPAPLCASFSTHHSSQPNATSPCRNPASVYCTTRPQHDRIPHHKHVFFRRPCRQGAPAHPHHLVSVDREVAERSILIKNLLEDIGESDEPIPIPNVCARHHLAYYRVSADSA